MKLGSQVPDFIDGHCEKIADALKECRPYDKWDCEENEDLFDTAIASAKEILRFSVKVRQHHRRGFGPKKAASNE